MQDITGRFSEEGIARDRVALHDTRRLLYLAIPGVVFVYGLITQNGWFDALGVILFPFGFAIFQAPRRRVRLYDATLAHWEDLLRRSDPFVTMTANFALRNGETIVFSALSQRFEERRIGQTINTQSRTKNAIAGAAVGGLLFGPAGAIVGGGMARRQTTGSATDIYNVVPVDDGQLTITTDRVVFLGQRNAVEVEGDKIISITPVVGTSCIAVQHASRAPGESYSVEPDFFALCMARRSHANYPAPNPPPPLPLTPRVTSNMIEHSLSTACTHPEWKPGRLYFLESCVSCGAERQRVRGKAT